MARVEEAPLRRMLAKARVGNLSHDQGVPAELLWILSGGIGSLLGAIAVGKLAVDLISALAG